MIVTKSINFKQVLKATWHHLVWLFAFMGGMASLYHFKIIQVEIPWLPVSVIGTAVAFYVGFKNNQAYDRMWEARKIWGGIVNDSRSWGMMIDGFITNQFSESKLELEEIQKIKRRLIYRHIAWLYAHRAQLLVPAPWEHIRQGRFTRRHAEKLQAKGGIGLVDKEDAGMSFVNLLPEEEQKSLLEKANTATQIINQQSRDLTQLREAGLINDFRHMELENLLRSFYALQGKNERIKKFPLPRQYANMSRYFVGIFIFLLPFSMMPELMAISDLELWLSIPITALLGWIYVMMEIIGDYSENPFQGMGNDIPMLSLCRTIEIDLREMLEETDIPPSIKSRNGVLM